MNALVLTWPLLVARILFKIFFFAIACEEKVWFCEEKLCFNMMKFAKSRKSSHGKKPLLVGAVCTMAKSFAKFWQMK